MLIFSNLIIMMTTTYISREVEFLMSQPVGHRRLFFGKLGESLLYSSWAFVILSFPFFVALVVIIAFVFGISYTWITVPAMTHIQEELVDEIRGRIFGVLTMLVSVFSFLPLIIVGPIADAWGVAPVFVGSAGLVGVLWWLGRTTRRRIATPSPA